jgi:hypothetical protein
MFNQKIPSQPDILLTSCSPVLRIEILYVLGRNLRLGQDAFLITLYRLGKSDPSKSAVCLFTVWASSGENASRYPHYVHRSQNEA